MKTESKKSDTDGWDELDEAGWESFPASDPPAHRPERTGSPAPEPDERASPADHERSDGG